MQEIVKAVEKLNELKPDWRLWYISNQFQNEDSNEDRNALFHIIRMVHKKEEQRIDHWSEEEEQKWKDYIQNALGEDVYNKMRNSFDTMLVIYQDMKVIRNLGENAVTFLADSIYNYSVYYDALFLDQNEKYGILDKMLFKNAVFALDTIIYTHVDRRFTKRTAKREFEEVTGLMEPYSSCYAELYEKYFGMIQGKQCLELLGNLNRKLDLLIEKQS